MHKIFRYLKIPETMKACPRNFRHYETENSSIKLFESEDFLKNSKIPSRKFSALWDKKNSIENRDMPPLIHKFFFRYQKISGKPKGSFQSFSFRSCETKKFRRKIVITAILHKNFRYLKIPETMKACPRNFRHYETENFRRKNVIPPFSSIKLFESEDFLKNSKIPSRKFSALWDKKNSIENRDMPPLIHKFFSIQKNFRKTEGFF